MNRFLMVVMAAALQLSGMSASGQTYRANGNNTILEDLDPNDGFDFVSELAVNILTGG